MAAWAAASEGYFCRAAAPWLGAGGHVIDVVGDTARLVRDLLRVGVSCQGKGKWVWVCERTLHVLIRREGLWPPAGRWWRVWIGLGEG